jgi:hypothetical protein
VQSGLDYTGRTLPVMVTRAGAHALQGRCPEGAHPATAERSSDA